MIHHKALKFLRPRNRGRKKYRPASSLRGSSAGLRRCASKTTHIKGTGKLCGLEVGRAGGNYGPASATTSR